MVGQATADATDPRVVDVAAAVARLPERERKVLLLVVVVGLAQHEVGAVMGVSQARVHTVYHRALRRLRSWLGARP